MTKKLPAVPNAPTCMLHGVMVADDEFGRTWRCAVCGACAHFPEPKKNPRRME